MNKTELIAIAAENAGLTKKDTERVLNAAIDAISLALVKGEKVQLSSFGTFETKTRQARIGRNPHTKEAVEIPATRVPAFKASYEVKVGDRIEISMGTCTVAVEVLEVADNVRKDDAAGMYKEV